VRSLTLLGLALAVIACGPATQPHRPGDDGARVLRYAVVTSGRPSGAAEIRIERDGTRRSHMTYNDRGRGPDVSAVERFDERGALVSLHATGHAYEHQPVDERLAASGGQLVWRSADEHGHGPAGGYYVPIHEGLAWMAPWVRGMRQAPGKRVALLPAGTSWIEDDRPLDVTLGGTTRHLHLVAFAGLGFRPWVMFFDEDGELFADVSPWTSVVRTGAESLVPQLLAADEAWHTARAARLARTLAHHPPAAGLAITHANLFDAERKQLVPDQTVVVVGDRITAVGGAATPVPPGAQVIDARGRTLLPGLWDMHVHLGGGDGLLDLAFGVTTVRDMGNTIDDLAARIARFDAGTELGPHVIRAGLIDGKDKYAAPTGILVGTADEARAAVARYADLGYPQIKIYSSVPPPLVPVIAAAAHARGLRVSGHVPNGMVASDAIAAGFDGIQHANFLMLQFLDGAHIDTRKPLRYVRVAERGASIDLDSDAVRRFLDLLVAHHTVIDPTLTVFEGQFVSDDGEIAPGMKPYLDRLPAQIARDAYGRGLPARPGQRATFRTSFAKMVDLVGRAWRRGVTVVAGTDMGEGMWLSRELELYVQAGIPPADVLALDTLGAARVMHVDRDTGSIAVGKAADLLLVDGDPTRDIGAVRDADVVVCRGVVYDPAELFEAIGMRPRSARVTTNMKQP